MLRAKLRGRFILASHWSDMSRNLKQPGDGPYKQIIVNELNLVFAKRIQSVAHWRSLKQRVSSKFSRCLTEKELAEEFNLKVRGNGV